MGFNGNLLPWSWGKKNLPIRKEVSSSDYTPYFTLQHDMNQVLDNFIRSFEAGMMPAFSEVPGEIFHPRVEVKESADDIRVSVELPGIEDKDIDVSISDSSLTIKGEKREEKEENTSGYYRMERSYGSFCRQISIPCEIDKDKAQATFNRGVLKVTLPKTAKSQERIKKIAIKKD